MNAAASDTNHFAGGVTLDALFRANAAARPGAVALADPVDRSAFTDGEPLRLTYAEADRAVDRLAGRLQSFGPPAGSVVALQLPNIVESVLATLAVLRAGFVAAPVPLLWRRSDLVSALAPIEPKVLITIARFGDERPVESVCEAAADLFSLSFPCAFGSDVPDGIIALDQEAETPREPAVARPAGGGVSIITFDAAAEGFFAAARNDAQMLAAGLAVLLEAGIESGDALIATLPANSLAGLGGAVVPWLLSGGTLELIQGMSPSSVAAAGHTGRAHILAPAAVAPEMVARRPGAFASCVAAHRGRTSRRDLSSLPCGRIVDLHAFGEIGMIAIRREDAGRPEPVPIGPISPGNAPGGPIVAETRIDDDRVLIRGPMVPTAPYPSEMIQPRLRIAGEGYVSTGHRCRRDGNGAFIVEAGPERVVSVGALRFGLDDLRSRLAACHNGIRIAVVDDALLGQRLRIEADNPPAALAALQAAGLSRLVVDALLRDTHGSAAS